MLAKAGREPSWTEDFDDSQFEKSDVLSETMNLDETALTAWDSESESELDIE